MNNIEILERLEQMQQTFRKDGLQGYEMAIVTAKKLINNLIQENKELKEENKRIKSLDYTALAEEMEMGLWLPRADVEEYYVPLENLNDYIPKSKVREKLKEEQERLKAGFGKMYQESLGNSATKILQELLEEGDK